MLARPSDRFLKAYLYPGIESGDFSSKSQLEKLVLIVCFQVKLNQRFGGFVLFRIDTAYILVHDSKVCVSGVSIVIHRATQCLFDNFEKDFFAEINFFFFL